MREHVSPDTEIAPLRMLRAEAAMPAEVQERIVRGALRGMERRRRRRWQALWIGAPCVAAAAALLVVLWLARGSGPGDAGPAVAGAIAPAPIHVHETGASAARVDLGAHRMDMAAHSRVEVTRAQAGSIDLVLTTGSADFLVDPLPAGHHFRVATGAALIEVVGTRFTVTIEDGCTSIAVTEGMVRVSPASADGDMLGAGALRTYCVSAREGPVAGERWVREALALVSEGRELARATVLLERYLAHHARGVFAEDALFHLGLLYQDQGRHADAVRAARHFVARFPGSRRAERLRAEILRAR